MDTQYEFKGNHFVASYLDCDSDALNNIVNLKKAMEEAVAASGATILNMVDHQFNPNGYTSAYILSESHATIHTYPEHNSCFVDLFTCGDHCSHEKFDKTLRQHLEPKMVRYEVIKRATDMKLVPPPPAVG